MNRNIELDALKGIAILTVVLFHLGLMPNGYLGVDIFLVINGYFITKGVISAYEKGSFGYFSFVAKRLVRLWPLVVLVGGVSLAAGCFTMLPDDLENLGQSVVASNFFLNNVLACITTGNYWDVVNAHKPLMHFWYLGIVVQWYVVYPLLFMGVRKYCKRNFLSNVELLLAVLVIVSLALYFSPFFSTAQKFYYLPFRIFEMGIGGLVAFRLCAQSKDAFFSLSTVCKTVFILCILFVILLNDYMNNAEKILIVSLLSGGVCYVSVSVNYALPGLKVLAYLGEASFSIYVWHQVLFAFYKYSFHAQLGWVDYAILLVLIAFISFLSYTWLEKPLGNWAKHSTFSLLGVTAAACVLTTAGGMMLYIKAGVLRDIPELNVSATDIHRGMHAEYCDRIYKLEKDFEHNGKLKVMVMGDSYGRDFVNVLMESVYKDSIDLRYMFPHRLELTEEQRKRVEEADVVFVRAAWMRGASGSLLREIRKCAKSKIWGIGTKEYGETNGNVYSKRFKADYHQTRVRMSENYSKDYEEELNYWGENYVDFIAPLMDDRGTLPAFTDNGMYISQDCRHLTQAGARYYAKVFDLKRFLYR